MLAISPNRPTQERRVGFIIASFISVLALAWLGVPRLAFAHAKLISSEPPNGTQLDIAPTSLKLLFTEDVGLDFSTARLLDSAGKEYEVGGLSHDGANTASLVVALQPDLGNGTYTLIWRVVSGIDGHLTLGTLVFRVGPAGQNEAPLVPTVPGVGYESYSSADQAPDAIRWAIRALILAAATLLLGGSIFTVLVVEPTAAEAGQDGSTLWRASGLRYAGIAAWAALVLVLALIIDLLAQVALIAGTDYLGALGKTDTMLTLLNSTRFGFAWIMKALAGVLLLVLMLLVWAFNRRGGSGLWEIGIAAGSLLLLAESLSSHAAAAVNSGQLLGLPVPLISDWLHLVTVATWIGGLGYMVFALFPSFSRLNFNSESRRAFLAKSIPRFSRLAVVSVVLLSITGTYNLIIHNTDVVAILSSTYGQVLALKILLFVVLVAFGAVNLRRLSPALQKQSNERGRRSKVEANIADSPPVTSLWRNIRVESALAALALICAGGLTLLPPPTEGVVGAAAPLATPTLVVPANQVISATQDLAGGYSVTAELSRSGGLDSLTLAILRSNTATAPLTDVSAILLRITPQDREEVSTALDAVTPEIKNADEVTAEVSQSIFPLDGTYALNATVRRTIDNDFRVAFIVRVTGGVLVYIEPVTAIQVRVLTEPSPPVAGTVVLQITIVDGLGQSVDGAVVSVSARRPASQDRPIAQGAAAVEGVPGGYHASLDLNAAGSWLLIFTVESSGQPPLKSDASIDVAP